MNIEIYRREKNLLNVPLMYNEYQSIEYIKIPY